MLGVVVAAALHEVDLGPDLLIHDRATAVRTREATVVVTTILDL